MDQMGYHPENGAKQFEWQETDTQLNTETQGGSNQAGAHLHRAAFLVSGSLRSRLEAVGSPLSCRPVFGSQRLHEVLQTHHAVVRRQGLQLEEVPVGNMDLKRTKQTCCCWRPRPRVNERVQDSNRVVAVGPRKGLSRSTFTLSHWSNRERRTSQGTGIRDHTHKMQLQVRLWGSVLLKGTSTRSLQGSRPGPRLSRWL